MTAAANTTTAIAAAISPHGRCGVTTLAGGRVRPLPALRLAVRPALCRAAPWPGWSRSAAASRSAGQGRLLGLGSWPLRLLASLASRGRRASGVALPDAVAAVGAPVRIPGARGCGVPARPGGPPGPREAGQYARAVTPEQLQRRRPDRRARRPSSAARSRSTSPTRSSSSARRTPSTATTPPTSRCGWPRPPAGRRARSPRLLAEELRGARRDRRASTSPVPASSTSPWPRTRSGQIAVQAVTAGETYGRTDALAGQRLNLEFVSANPTGPVHIGGTRWAAVGDALGRLLDASGADVTREYYFNDAGAQIDRFAKSLQAAAQGRAGARGRLRRRLHRRHRRPGRRRRARPARPAARTSSSRSSATRGVELMCRRDPQLAGRLRRRTSTSTSPSGRCTRPGRWRRRSPGCASRATSTRPTARCGCGRPTSATTRTGCWSRATASAPTSPPTAPTTWTSATAASTRS